MPSAHLTFEQRLDAALASPDLETALTRALPTFRQKRNSILEDGHFDERQQHLAEIRRRGVDRLPELVARFTEEATKVGCVVHQAATADDARRIVGQLARERGVKLVVKSKTMAAEEIMLNPFLEADGIKIVETDLGEWILQLAGEHPSHLLAPALHKTREQIAALLGQVAGRDLSTADNTELVGVARKHLRQSFIDADMGISGANIAIADTGTIIIVTNEGNGRLVTTLPPIHVALVGIDKLVPTIDEATEILKLLVPSATGQKISTYVSFTTGPSRSADIELSLTMGVHGPKEVHIVLIDNGRWQMHADPQFREALQCIRCGACANVCPPYQVVGGHVFGHIYTGPIGVILTAFHHGLDNAAGPQSLCVSCNACEQVCPAGIPLARQILDLRQRYVAQTGLTGLKRLAVETLADPVKFDRGTRYGSLVQLPLTGGGKFAQNALLRHAPLGVGSLLDWRSLPALARSPLRDRVAKSDGNLQPYRRLQGTKALGLRIAYFAGCMTDRLYPEMGEAVIRVLRAAGCDVFFPPAQSCCGLPAINAGDGPSALKMIHQTITALEDVSADYILSGSTSCVVSLLQDYPRLLADEPAWLARAQKLASRVTDFTSFFARVVDLPDDELSSSLPLQITYHDSCQSHNCLELREEPRHVLRDVLGVEIVEMNEASACCGFGGSFSFEHPRVARRIALRKLHHADKTGAKTIVTDNPGCIMHLRGAIDASGRQIEVLHLAELIDRRLR